MMLSVVVPAYNEERYIEACLRSIRAQSMDVELVVVDNGSEDATPRIAEEYADRVVYEPRRGVAFARDAGWRHAKGELVAFTDADTVVPETWAELMSGALSAADAAYGPVYLADGSAVEKLLARYGFTAFLWVHSILGMPHFSGQNFGVRRSLLELAGGFNLSIEVGEDFELSRRLRKLGRVVFVPQMHVYTSSRRLRAGRLRFLMHNAANYISILLTGSSRLRMEAVR
ncbi:MAG: glycosyltransferase [Euryarchaeota archaeon]|nr:glycosyltransferase [Euryarchaeota archaeon]